VYLPDGIARAFNRAVFNDGLFAHVMEYPMVAPGMERLRISMGAQHTRDEIVEALAIIDRASQRFGVVKP
jgi:glycine C-acetyltransferase